MKLKINLLFVFLLLLSSFSLALTKPIVGTINFQDTIDILEVKVLVETNDTIIGKQNCVIKPSIFSSNSGSFSTNLENLVLENFPNVKCNSFWKIGDLIWYEFNYKGKSFTSTKEKIKSGTGLQELSALNLPKILEENIPSSNTGSSGGNGGTTISNPQINLVGNNISVPNLNSSILKMSVNLSSKENILNLVINPSIKDLGKEIYLKVVVFSFPGQESVKTFEEKIILNSKNTKSYSLKELSPSWYKAQAFVYFENKLILTSSLAEIFISGKKVEVPSAIVPVTPINQKLQMPADTTFYIGPMFYSIAFILVLIAFILFLTRKNKHDALD